jgi:probable HAF family extracellular repeat protein
MSARILSALGFAIAATAAHAEPPPTRYVVTSITIADLGTLGGTESLARDINDSGRIVGWSRSGQARKRAFLYGPGGMEDIGPGPAVEESDALGINAHNVVVGRIERFHLSPVEIRAFRWAAGATAELLPVTGSGAICTDCSSQAVAINDSNNIAGSAWSRTSGDEWPVIWRSAGATASVLLPKGPLPPIFAFDINNHDQIVAYDKGIESPFRWTAGSITWIPDPPETSTDRYVPAENYGINDRGATVGRSMWATSAPVYRHGWRATWWSGASDAEGRDLGVLLGGTESVAYEVNEQSFVAGYSSVQTMVVLPEPATYLVTAAFIWHNDFGMRRLPSLPASQPRDTCRAYALNNRKSNQTGLIQVVGYCDVGGKPRAVRWDVSTRVQPVM